MDTINGLPAHPFFVHAPVVLTPLAAAVAVVLAVRPGRRADWSLHLAGGAVVILVLTQLTVSSGEALAELAGDAIDVTRHRGLGLMARNLVAAFAVLATLTAGLDRRRGRIGDVGEGEPGSDGGRWPAVGAGLSALAAVAAVVWMARAGDEGARLVWESVVRSAQGG